jgi:hypothetical protein
MGLLGHNSYLPVSAVKKEYRFVCLDETQKELILKNVAFISKLEAQGGYPADRFFNFFSLINEDLEIGSGPLEHIFLNAVIDSRDFIQDQEQFYDFYKDKLICIAEIFKGNSERSNYGAGRNILLKDLELKGVGRNNSASRLDYQHAWGGMYLLEAIFEFFLSNLLNYSTHLGSERAIAIGVTSETEVLNSDTPAILVRQRSSPRVSMCNKHFIAQSSKAYLERFFSDPYFFENQILQYLTLNFNGFFHKSMILENATLNGKIIDCNSIELTDKRNGIIGSFIINPHMEEPAIESIPELLKARTLSIENNSLENLYHVLQSTLTSYKQNISDCKRDTKLVLKNILDQISPQNDNESVCQLLNLIFKLPSEIGGDKSVLGKILNSVLFEVFNFKRIQRSRDFVFMVEFYIPLNFQLPKLHTEFNNSRKKTMDPFFLNLIKALPYLPREPLVLTDLLFSEVLKMTQISPFEIGPDGNVALAKLKVKDLPAYLKNLYNAESYLFFYEESEQYVQKWHASDSIISLQKECIIYGIKTGKTIRPITPLYFIK